MLIKLEDLPGQVGIEVARPEGEPWVMAFNVIEIDVAVLLEGKVERLQKSEPDSVGWLVALVRAKASPRDLVAALTDHDVYTKYLQASKVVEQLGKAPGPSPTSPPATELSSSLQV